MIFSLPILLSLITFIATPHERVPEYIKKAESTSVIVRAYVQTAPLFDKVTVSRRGFFRMFKKVSITELPIEVENDRYICSGSVIDNDGRNNEVILTARHCFDSNYVRDIRHDSLDEVTTVPTSVKFMDGDIGEVKDVVNDIISDDSDDLMLMHVHSSHNHHAVSLNIGKLVRHQELIGMGAPNGYFWSAITLHAIQGSMLVKEYAPGWDYTISLEGPAIDHGISGGGVYDLNGNIVGVIVGIVGDKSIGVMIPSIRVKTWLDRVSGDSSEKVRIGK